MGVGHNGPVNHARTVDAIVVRTFGGPEVLRLERVPVPAYTPGEVLVEVVAAGVNPVDVSNHEDGAWAQITLPYTPGSDLSGVVRAVGADVRDLAPGDEVFGFTDFMRTRQGSYAQLQPVPAALLARKPRRLTHAEAASVPLAAGTAYEVIVTRLRVTAGERVVIVGAAGGVGGFATQLAATRGAQVIAVSRARTHTYVREMGAALAIDPAADDRPVDPVAAVRAALGHVDVDVVVDLAGQDTIARYLPLLREGGRVATITALSGDLDRAIDLNSTIHGVLVRPDGPRLAALTTLLEAGTLHTTIRAEHPLADAPTAHTQVRRGGTPGKTVLRVRPEPTPTPR
jgi:NADPH:quinone reductase